MVVLKEDKGRGVVILDKNIYGQQSLYILDTYQFINLDKISTSSYESKIHRTI